MTSDPKFIYTTYTGDSIDVNKQNTSNTWYGPPYVGQGTRAEYYKFELPEPKMPYKVYLGGKLVTLGILGTDVQVSYTGGKCLVFHNTFDVDYTEYKNKKPLSLEYKDCIYHYNIEYDSFGAVLDKLNYVIAKLVSKVNLT